MATKKIGRKPTGIKQKLISGFQLPVEIVDKLDRVVRQRSQTRRDFFRGAIERANES